MFDNDCDINFYVKNVIGHSYSWNKYFVICSTNSAKNYATCHSTLQVVKLKIHLLQHLFVVQSWYNKTTDAT